MSDFSQITKYLDLVRASKDTTETTKPLSLTKSRAIKKIFKEFTIPGFPTITFSPSERFFKRLVSQVNVSMISNFRIIEHTFIPVLNVSPIVAIRWRNGNTVTRYSLSPESLFSTFIGINVPAYTNQLIPRYFVVEFWKRNTLLFLGMPNLTIKTNLYTNPETPEQTSVVIDDITEAERTDLFHAFPEPIPTLYGEDSAWLDNN